MKTKASKLYKIIIYGLLLIQVLIVGFPLVYAIGGSFKSTLEFLEGGINIFPKEWRWQNYAEAWNLAKFGRYTYNSVFVSLMTVIGTLITTSLTGYTLSRRNFLLKKPILVLFGATLFVTGAITLFPTFLMARDLKLLNSLNGLIIVQIANAQAMYSILMMGYINGISKEIDEAATIDGCSFFKTYLHILLPIIKPILATVSILAFRDSWNNFMLPLAFTLSTPRLRTLTVGVISIKDQGQGISAWNLMIAGTVISLAPIMILYLFMNKYFIAGMTEGSVKG